MPVRVPPPKPSIMYNLFTPLPASEESDHRDVVDHVSDYMSTTQGAWDFFRLAWHVVEFAKKVPAIVGKWSGLLDGAGAVANNAGIALSLPSLISDGNSLHRSLTAAWKIHHLNYSDPQRGQKIAQAYKKAVLDSLAFTNTTAQAALFLDSSKVFPLKPHHFPITDGIYNGTSLILDGSDLVSHCYQLKTLYKEPIDPNNATVKKHTEEKKTFSWMRVVQNTASIGASVIAMTGILFTVGIEAAAVLATVSLALGAVWLTLKISSYFYEKIVLNAHSEQTVQPLQINVAMA